MDENYCHHSFKKQETQKTQFYKSMMMLTALSSSIIDMD